MLYFLAAVLVIVWLIGVIISYALVGIHLLLVIAIILVIVRYISGNKKTNQVKEPKRQ